MKAATVTPGTAGSARLEEVPEPDAIANDMVLKNIVAFGSVNANRRQYYYYYYAAKILAAADPAWLEQLITRRVRPEDVQQGLQREPGQGRLHPPIG
jgi:hypothetical protein